MKGVASIDSCKLKGHYRQFCCSAAKSFVRVEVISL